MGHNQALRAVRTIQLTVSYRTVHNLAGYFSTSTVHETVRGVPQQGTNSDVTTEYRSSTSDPTR